MPYKRLPQGVSQLERRQALLNRFAMMAHRGIYRRGTTKRLTNWEIDHCVAVDVLLEYIDDEEITDAFNAVPRI